MSEEKQDLRSPRDRAYDLHFLKKLGELADFAGRALTAAGVGGGIVARLAQEKVPTAGFWEWALALGGLGFIYWGVAMHRPRPRRTRNSAMFDTNDPFMMPTLFAAGLFIALQVLAWMHRDRRGR